MRGCRPLYLREAEDSLSAEEAPVPKPRSICECALVRGRLSAIRISDQRAFPPGGLQLLAEQLQSWRSLVLAQRAARAYPWHFHSAQLGVVLASRRRRWQVRGQLHHCMSPRWGGVCGLPRSPGPPADHLRSIGHLSQALDRSS
jgi:hypothetical protein